MDFEQFSKDVERIFHKTKKIADGKANSKKEENHYAISICTVDGKKLNLGDFKGLFQLQSACKPINYAIALHELSEKKVHQHVGREPSGREYNGLLLNPDNLPHNPMINAGAIMTCSLILPEKSLSERYKHIKKIWSRLSGGGKNGFSEKRNETEGKSSSRNMALCYHMLEKNAFPKNTDIYKTMELYNKCCNMEVDIDQLAMVSATLANGGECPETKDRIFSAEDIRDCLSLMLSCGMYDYSGEFAFLVGLPAKSGVSGAMMVVVPGIMGIGIYSPPLDGLGNPVRGIAFCKELVKEYSFHMFDHIVDPPNRKRN